VCGIVLLSGPRAASRLPECLRRLRHRGPDDEGTWVEANVALGFARLAINGDGPVGHQPHRHADFVAAINGEIYNHEELARAHGLRSSACDTHVIAPMLEVSGPRVIDELDGFYSGVVVRTASRGALCLRDHMGKKPLFVGRSSTEVFITSEVKVFDEIDWFEPLPLGVAKVDLDTGEVTRVASHRPVTPERDLASSFQRAVRKRMPHPDQPLGVFLSGGIDSSLVAAFASRIRSDITYFTLGNADGPDHRAVKSVVESLGLRDVRSIPLPPSTSIPALVREVVRVTESFNPSIVSNGLATYLLAKAAHDAGIKVVLTGEGADELFGGYHLFQEHEPWREVRAQLIDDMQFTELRRLDLSCMAHAVEPRCPFLDREVRAISDALEFHDLFEGSENKMVLRRSFDGVLPTEILHRRKTSCDVGSGIRGAVVRYLRGNGRSEREELRGIWGQMFAHDHSKPYFHAYPVLDAAIDKRGEAPR
jgi:asparagine synthase (glutamine-hydrolysing)